MESLYLALELDWAFLLLASANKEFISEAQLEVHRFPMSYTPLQCLAIGSA